VPPSTPPDQATEFERKSDADKYFLARTLEIRTHSDDPKAAGTPQSGVGALIVDRSGRIVAESANVLPPELKLHFADNDRSLNDAERYFFLEHAERAAIFKALLAGANLKGATLYGSRFPCSDCARAILWSGIGRAVFGAGYSGERRWLDSQRAAVEMLRASGVVVRVIKAPPHNLAGTLARS
jgi:dCMP deaminase